MLNSRSAELEILDLGQNYYTLEEYNDCMIKLDLIGKWLGGDSTTISALQRMDPPPQSILDIGCGGGLSTIRLASKFPHAQILGIDLNPLAINFAKNRLHSMKGHPSNVRFETRDREELSEPCKSYDAVISTLVCHHLTDEALIEFISKSCSVAKSMVIINDLHRHPLALYLFKFINLLFFRNRLVQNDGPLSIRRAFTHNELDYFLKKTGLKASQYSIRWKWAFRWLVEINCNEHKDD